MAELLLPPGAGLHGFSSEPQGPGALRLTWSLPLDDTARAGVARSAAGKALAGAVETWLGPP